MHVDHLFGKFSSGYKLFANDPKIRRSHSHQSVGAVSTAKKSYKLHEKCLVFFSSFHHECFYKLTESRYCLISIGFMSCNSSSALTFAGMSTARKFHQGVCNVDLRSKSFGEMLETLLTNLYYILLSAL
uniref:Ovule protein n=1 Tax=Ascaris lumbricoides TaxID=6252 RepID=A0A0M3I160_ASCLU